MKEKERGSVHLSFQDFSFHISRWEGWEFTNETKILNWLPFYSCNFNSFKKSWKLQSQNLLVLCKCIFKYRKMWSFRPPVLVVWNLLQKDLGTRIFVLFNIINKRLKKVEEDVSACRSFNCWLSVMWSMLCWRYLKMLCCLSLTLLVLVRRLRLRFFGLMGFQQMQHQHFSVSLSA